MYPIFTSTRTLNMFRLSSNYRCLIYGDDGLIKAPFGGVFRFLSASSHGGSITFDEDNKLSGVGNLEFDVFLGEIKGNDDTRVDVLPSNPEGNRPLKLFSGELKSSSLSGGVPNESNGTLKLIREIVSIIRCNDSDMERKLSKIAPDLSLRSTIEVFEALNWQKVSGVRFFRWVKLRNQKLSRTADFHSLIVNNCGWLNDYESMESLLKEFRSQRICLMEKAFEFLPAFGSDEDSVKESIRHMVNLLNEVGGSCRNSGIHAMIRMLCRLDFFDMAKFVIEITERTVSHYNILIHEKCRKGHIEEAQSIIKEMRESGCDPGTSTYNYILGSLYKIDKMKEACSVFEEMKGKGIAPDALSFEMFISYFCSLGKLEQACQFVDQMVSDNVRPRLTTHAAIIKALFKSEEHEKAYRYVIDSSLKDAPSSSMLYSLLLGLHLKNGDLLSTPKIILEMMDKGLHPNYRVFMKAVSKLQRSGQGSLAKDLQNRYLKVTLASTPQLDKLVQ